MAKQETIKPVASKGYEVVGLKAQDVMPMRFEGRWFDLAALTVDELTYLKAHKEVLTDFLRFEEG